MRPRSPAAPRRPPSSCGNLRTRSWYGQRYGDHQDHSHGSRRPTGRDSCTGLRRTDLKRLWMCPARGADRPPRCGWMEGHAGVRAGAKRGPIDQEGTGLGRCAPHGGTTKRPDKAQGAGVSGITFDAGGLIAVDRGDRRVLALVARAAERGLPIMIPATALARAIRRNKRDSPGSFVNRTQTWWRSTGAADCGDE